MEPSTISGVIYIKASRLKLQVLEIKKNSKDIFTLE